MANSLSAHAPAERSQTTFAVLLALSFCHLLNDMMQSLIPAIYPMLKSDFGLDFGQIGILTLAFQATASLFQPVVGIYTDRYRSPYSLAIGMGFTFAGLIYLSRASHFYELLAGACVVGLGSAIFHPDSSRMARLASGGRYGLAQSVFQVGGNAGTALGPLLAAFVVLQNGQRSIIWFSGAALLAMVILWQVGKWAIATWARNAAMAGTSRRLVSGAMPNLSRARTITTIVVLMVLMFSKFVYTSSFASYYTFYLIERFHLSVQDAQLHLFVFLVAVAVGTILGGPIGDRVGRKYVIWGSILGVLPFTLALPYANLLWTGVLSVFIGLILSAAFAAIIVFAQELMPHKIGLMSGLFFGFAFGVAGVGAAVMGYVADWKGIEFVFSLTSYFPAFGILAIFLPDLKSVRPQRRMAESTTK